MFYEKSLKIKSPLEIRFLEDCTSEGWKIVRITGKSVYKYGEKIAEEIRGFDTNDDSWNYRAYGDNFND